MSYRGGLGQVAMGSWPVMLIQSMLMNRGYSVGAGGTSGTLDSGTRRALEVALGKPEGSLASSPDLRATGAPGAQLVEMPRGWFEVLTNLPPRAPAVAEPGAYAMDRLAPTGALPYVIGAAAAVGAGYLIWRGVKRR